MKFVKSYFFIIFLFTFSCSGIDFVLKTNKSKNLMDGRTSYSVQGNGSEYMADVLIERLGILENYNRFNLDVGLEEKIVKTAINTNQVTSAIQYNVLINYELTDLEFQCKKITKLYSLKFNHYPKAEGYNFGTDRALRETYNNVLSENLSDFITSVESDTDFNNCLNEN